MLKTIKPTKMRISRSLSNPLRTIGHIWPVFTVLYISLNISRFWLLFFKNNPIFDISGKFAIEWWYGFTYLIKNSLRKRLAKIGDMKRKTQFFENRPGIKGLNKTPCKKIFVSKNAILDLYIMVKQHLDQNYDFKKLLGALINPLSAKDVYTRFEPRKWPYRQKRQN